jgi:hypothetical protein
MIRKNFAHSILLILSSFIALPSLAHSKQDDLLFNGALALGAIVATKGYSYLKQNSLEDTPTHYEKWARKVLASKGIKNADTISLKIDDNWTFPNEHFLAIDKNQAQKIEDVLNGTLVLSEDEKKSLFAKAKGDLLYEAILQNNNYMYKIIGAEGAALLLNSLLQEYEPSLDTLPVKMTTMTTLPLLTKKHLDQQAHHFVKTSMGPLAVTISKK